MVHIVGAGPGDPELITRKGARLLAEADVVIYAGSLVNPALLDLCKEGAEIHDSAGMTLDDVLAVVDAAEAKGLTTVRLHTGDPAVYGAIQEQMDAWRKKGISYDVTPGVSSCFAAAAALRQEYTLPGISQTLIITRGAGRTPVPEPERLKSLAQHGATMCIYLSVSMIDEVANELVAGGYEPTTPIAVVQRASWPDEQIVRGTLADIAEKVQAAGITRQAMIVVSRCLDADYDLSRLYAPEFSHGYRQASAPAADAGK
ncbi:precorrin-4 C(11)-methyltransferase [Selenomonas sp.]|uniref:precorrin-4 C(11)-methyltransferase n=1 Tax=Selenomonas sp. TaxID=2053611 RepID=UPI002A75E6D9|nr:precorrin-4 C(11)-methyltransferase [Selenomonas sp.]MDY3297065.1 precorrin-4 C(11)-methyltransferase [Selenomonas sp.]